MEIKQIEFYHLRAIAGDIFEEENGSDQEFGGLTVSHVFPGNQKVHLTIEEVFRLRPDLFTKLCSGCITNINKH